MILLEEIDFLRAQVAQLQNYVLMTGPAPVSQTQHHDPGPAFSRWDRPEPGQRAYSTEVEEDVEFMAQEGIIDEEQAARILKEAGVDLDEFDIMTD